MMMILTITDLLHHVLALPTSSKMEPRRNLDEIWTIAIGSVEKEGYLTADLGPTLIISSPFSPHFPTQKHVAGK